MNCSLARDSMPKYLATLKTLTKLKSFCYMFYKKIYVTSLLMCPSSKHNMIGKRRHYFWNNLPWLYTAVDHNYARYAIRFQLLFCNKFFCPLKTIIFINIMTQFLSSVVQFSAMLICCPLRFRKQKRGKKSTTKENC